MVLGTSIRARRVTVLRDLTIQLVVRELKLRYRRTTVGLAWSFAFPLGQVLVFSFIFTLVLPTRVGKYSAFVSIGVLVWTWFQSSLVAAATAITGNRELVRRPGFPASVLPISTVATYLVLFLMAFPALIGVVIYDGGHLGPGLAAVPLILLVQFILTLGISYLVASLNVRFRDTQQMVTLLLLLFFFLTPVFYDASSVPTAYQALYNLNPFVVLLDGYRTALEGGIPNVIGLVEVGLAAALLAVIGHILFTRASYRFAEEI
jgi:lipopolysaccharide transport system permease protein